MIILIVIYSVFVDSLRFAFFSLGSQMEIAGIFCKIYSLGFIYDVTLDNYMSD